ncbi:MAG: hypothetical protein IKW64_05495 [Clostridia bacterium]|nr:hypothetical protein [Clostridia bacterium]
MSNIHDRHRERLDRKVDEYGLEMLEPHEQLEHLLFAVIPRGDTNAVAHRLLERFITVAGVLNADVEELAKIEGVGKRTAMFLSTMPALLGIVERNIKVTEPPRLYDMKEIQEYVTTYFHGKLVESAYLFSLNSSFRLIAVSKISEGTHDRTVIHRSRVIKQAIKDNAAVALVVHNHPCGNPKPSLSDISLSRSLSEAFESVDIKFADSIIVSGNDIFSIRSNGYLKEVNKKKDYEIKI